MDSNGLANQAVGLTNRKRSIIGLLALGAIDPLLELDISPAGQKAVQRARLLWAQGWNAVLDNDVSQTRRTEESVASSDEILRGEEPVDSSIFRLDFLVGLLYALRSYDLDSLSNLMWCLQRIDESLDLLQDKTPSLAVTIDMSAPIFGAIKDLEENSDPDIALIEEVRNRFAPAREACRQAVRAIESALRPSVATCSRHGFTWCAAESQLVASWISTGASVVAR
jgi:hypothetical protein